MIGGLSLKFKGTNNEQIKIDDTLMRNGIVLKKSYLEETYGSEIESMPEGGKKTEETKGKL